MGEIDLVFGCITRELQHAIDTGTATYFGQQIAQGFHEELAKLRKADAEVAKVKLSAEEILLRGVADGILVSKADDDCQKCHWLPELIEALADLEHERWSGWEKYRSTARTEEHPNGEMNVDRWVRQRRTAYANLSEEEKQSDRDQVMKTLAVLERFGVHHG